MNWAVLRVGLLLKGAAMRGSSTPQPGKNRHTDDCRKTRQRQACANIETLWSEFKGNDMSSFGDRHSPKHVIRPEYTGIYAVNLCLPSGIKDVAYHEE